MRGIAGSLLSWIKDVMFIRALVTQVGAERSSEKGLVSGIRSWHTLTMPLISCRPTALINCSLTI